MIKTIRPIFYLAFFSILFQTQCTKESGISISSNIFCPISDGNQECNYIFQTLDGGILIISTTDTKINTPTKFILLSKYSDLGNEEWTKEIPCEGEPKFSSLSDGGIIIITRGEPQRLIKVDNSGNVLFNKIFNDSLNEGYYRPALGNDNHFYSTFFKVAPWVSDTNSIFEFDEGGNWLKNKNIKTNDADFGGLLASQYIYKVEVPKVVYFCGLVYENPVNLWANPHVFVSKFEYSDKKLVTKKNVIFDVANQTMINDANNFHYLNVQNDLFIMTQRIAPNHIYSSYLLKIDETLKKVWDVEIKAGVGNTFGNSISICPDGNFLIAGDCQVAGKAIYQPFAMKVDKNGTVLWTRTYDLKGYGRFVFGIQHENGNIFLGGSTTSFGEGLNLKDLLLIKTDADGNIK